MYPVYIRQPQYPQTYTTPYMHVYNVMTSLSITCNIVYGNCIQAKHPDCIHTQSQVHNSRPSLTLVGEYFRSGLAVVLKNIVDILLYLTSDSGL